VKISQEWLDNNQKHYSLNKKYPLMAELKKVFSLKYGLEARLAKAFKGLEGLKGAYIFGSYAKGNFGQESDIDLLLIGGHSSIEAGRLLRQIEKTCRREFSAVNMTEKEFAAGKASKDEFISDIFRQKIIKII
jgi:predicted nucleotidyltransferase